MSLIETMLGGIVVSGMMFCGAKLLQGSNYLDFKYGSGKLRRTSLTPNEWYMIDRDIKFTRLREKQEAEARQIELLASIRAKPEDSHPH